MNGNVVLVGFMGSGKTTVGRILAERLGARFVDTDALVEEMAGKPIAALFAEDGEEAFRRLEAEAVRRVAVEGGQVIATGGGVPVDPANVERLAAKGVLVFLEASPASVLARLGPDATGGRPLLAGGDAGERARSLLEARRPAYARADGLVATDGVPPDAVAERILRWLSTCGPAVWSGRGVPSDRVDVRLGARSYPVRVAAGCLGRIALDLLLTAGFAGTRRALLVTHPGLLEPYGTPVQAALEVAGFRVRIAAVPPGEASKSLRQAERLYDEAIAAGLDRRSVVVALGGGVIGDLAGFVAATYMRGIPLVQVPTTLLAQVDSSVGGKVAVDHPLAKNLIGAFHQPTLVLADVGTLRTLSPREFAAGMAEVIKHGVIADPAYFQAVEERRPAIQALDASELVRVVAGSCRIKAAVVEADEREESGSRMALNLGHTVAHAVEAAEGYTGHLHGEAVAMGMVAEAGLAARLGLCPPADVQRLETVLRAYGLPTRLPPLPLDRLLAPMALDKKAAGGRVRWALPAGIGRVVFVDDVPDSAVTTALLEAGAQRDDA
ncbi:MAG: 3-dehydroquinate synthase, partial [Clostridia bacterium]|nr:3-dehydroquinate synthase [Clostridia bacterium]